VSRPRVFLVDDEALPLATLKRLVAADGRLDIVGTATDPAAALEQVRKLRPDAILLDVQMPEMDGFALLSKLASPPHTIFVTAYDQYAVRAFEVNSIDYLLKPVSAGRLRQAVDRLLARCRDHPDALPLQALVEQMASALRPPQFLRRVALDNGASSLLLQVEKITHFLSEQRYTYAVHAAGRGIVSYTLQELEGRLDPQQFYRIHRSALVNLEQVVKVSRWFGGRLCVTLAGRTRSELIVSKDRAKGLKEALGLRASELI
jgi:DNA-binding LytR/AlgR family response regulator